jgi:hypothetical protein
MAQIANAMTLVTGPIFHLNGAEILTAEHRC